jgi:hypothetical protein
VVVVVRESGGRFTFFRFLLPPFFCDYRLWKSSFTRASSTHTHVFCTRGRGGGRGGAVQLLNPVDPWLESAWFQPLILRNVISWFQSLCFQMQLVPQACDRLMRGEGTRL